MHVNASTYFYVLKLGYKIIKCKIYEMKICFIVKIYGNAQQQYLNLKFRAQFPKPSLKNHNGNPHQISPLCIPSIQCNMVHPLCSS
jgi:hypothetical protein